MSTEARATVWDTILVVVIVAVGVYALGLVLAGLVLAETVFDQMGFGLDDGGISGDTARGYLRLVFGILGAVIIGWMATLVPVVRGPLRRREPWAWWAIVAAASMWFVLDTGLSLALGFVGHAVFNLGFAAALGVPLAALRPPGPELRGSRP
ncbi:MAG: hypothetical protein AAF467_24115 [Actinomycetota bacterium]